MFTLFAIVLAFGGGAYVGYKYGPAIVEPFDIG